MKEEKKRKKEKPAHMSIYSAATGPKRWCVFLEWGNLLKRAASGLRQKMKLDLSSNFYSRQLVRRMSEKMGASLLSLWVKVSNFSDMAGCDPVQVCGPLVTQHDGVQPFPGSRQ